MSSPTMSASSIGPMGMPKSFAAASIVSARHALVQHQHRLERGRARARGSRGSRARDLHGSGSLSIWRAKACAACITSGEVCGPSTISTSIICATGLKKCSRRGARGAASTPDSSCSGMLEVLEARMAVFLHARLDAARRACASSRRSRRSPRSRGRRCATPSPVTSGMRRSIARLHQVRLLAGASCRAPRRA